MDVDAPLSQAYVCLRLGTGTGMSLHVAKKGVWFCITSPLNQLVRTDVSLSSGLMTTAAQRTTSSANTRKVGKHSPLKLLLVHVKNTVPENVYVFIALLL